jgi:serine protease inhibitor ecotin
MMKKVMTTTGLQQKQATSNALPLVLCAIVLVAGIVSANAQGNLETQLERFVPQPNYEERIDKSLAEQQKREEQARRKLQKQKKETFKSD